MNWLGLWVLYKRGALHLHQSFVTVIVVDWLSGVNLEHTDFMQSNISVCNEKISHTKKSGLSSPCGARAFHELRRYQKCTFWEKRILGTQIYWYLDFFWTNYKNLRCAFQIMIFWIIRILALFSSSISSSFTSSSVLSSLRPFLIATPFRSKHQRSTSLFTHNFLSSPRGAWAFDELRRYHSRPSQFNWGPKMYILGKGIIGT